MYRLIPILLVFFILSFVIFIVDNLTPKETKKEITSEEESKISEELDISKNSKFNNEKKEINEDLALNEEKVESKEIYSENINTNNIQNENKEYFIIQFGAFGKKNSAIKFQEKINKGVRKKFADFNIVVLFDEKKSIYRLIYKVEEKKDAQKICMFSKKLEFDCYIKNEKL